MHLSHIASMFALICVLPLSLSFALDRSKVTRETVLQSRDTMDNDFLYSDLCLNSAAAKASCVVVYQILTSAPANTKPVNIRSYDFPCNNQANSINKDHENKAHDLYEDFDYDTTGSQGKSGYNNVKISIQAYGDLEGPVHAPIIKIGPDELTVTPITTIPTDFASIDAPRSIIWGAVYDCRT